MKFFPLFLLAAVLAAPSLPAAEPDPAPAPIVAPSAIPPTTAPADLSAESFVRVNSTNQKYNFTRPWVKRPPFSRRGIGVVLEGGLILITAELIADHNYIEIEHPTTSAKIPADVHLVDYEANLALIKPTDPAFLADATPIPLAEPLAVGDAVDLVQIERNGAVATTGGLITTITVSSYPIDGIGLLTYAVSAPLQYRDNSFTLPVVADGALAGLLMRYDARSQTATLIPDPVIRAFLDRAKLEKYTTFPRAGIGFSPTRDPQFRRFLNMNGTETGIYVSKVFKGSPSEKAGLKKGDVILEVNGNDIDDDGNYADPQFGRIPFGHLISTADPAKKSLPFKILRDGETQSLELPLEPRDPNSIISPTFLTDQQPRFLILGGVVFQELSRPFLEEWGADWRSDAPQQLVYLDAFQEELPTDQGRIVFVSQVLPTNSTLGYESLSTIVVDKVNGQPIRSLEDVAAAAKNPTDGFHKIEFSSDPGLLFLDADQTANQAEELRKTYGLPTLENLKK